MLKQIALELPIYPNDKPVFLPLTLSAKNTYKLSLTSHTDYFIEYLRVRESNNNTDTKPVPNGVPINTDNFIPMLSKDNSAK